MYKRQPFHQAALGFVGAALGLAGFVGGAVEFFERDGTAERFERVLMGVAVAALGPGGWRRALPFFLVRANSRSFPFGLLRVRMTNLWGYGRSHPDFSVQALG